MPIVERPEYPRKFKLKDTAIYMAVIVAVLGFLFVRCNQKHFRENVIIHGVGIDEYDTNFIRLGYDIENKGNKREQVDLLAKVYDRDSLEIASIFFRTSVPPQTREFQSKVIDKLYRPLQEGEKPHRATMEIRTRDILGY